jgi:hypothetical protein
MLPSWANDTVVRIRPGTKESRGSVIPDWDHATEAQITGCSVQPGSTSLDQDGRVMAISDGFTAYLPPGADVQAGDKIRYAGKEYQIRGEPRPWNSPTGRVSSIQIRLERWAG